MADLSSQIEKDASALTIEDDSIKGIANLAKQAKEMAKQIEDQESTLKEMKKSYRKLTEEIIPEALNETGMSSFVMNDGSTVSLKKFYSASIPKARESECFEYLRERGLDDIIKNQYQVSFGRGEDNLAKQLIEVLNGHGFPFSHKMGVHPKTLEATMREQIEQGREFDISLFNGFVGQRAIIKS
jgi:hypothetical protein